MNIPYYLRLPFLHPELGKDDLPSGLHFWPFSETAQNPAKFWRPPALPLPAEEARAFLQDLCEADGFELERQRQILLNKPFPAKSQAERDEMDALRAFSHNAAPALPPGADSSTELIEAQLFLLRGWAQEEKILELARLEENCASLDARLLSTLLEDVEDWLDLPEARSSADLSLLPAWHEMAAAVINFTPTELPLLLEGVDPHDLGAAAWRPVGELAPFADAWPEAKRLLSRKASLAELRQRNARPGSAMASQRIWLIMEE